MYVGPLLPDDSVLLCPCHAAVFDAADNAKVLAGPTDVPLASLPIVVDAASGTIYLGGRADRVRTRRAA